MTTPGFIRLPVCNPGVAFAAWSQDGGPSVEVDNYPCIGLQSIGYCDTSTFQGDTTDASPLVSDCQLLVQDILDRGQYQRVEHNVLTGPQSSIESHGTCVFGVQSDYVAAKANAAYKVGGQDIIDLITDSISRFSYNGKVGASGGMDCKGDLSSQWVKWSLYHSNP